MPVRSAGPPKGALAPKTCRAVTWRDSHSQAQCKRPVWKDGLCRDHYKAKKKKEEIK